MVSGSSPSPSAGKAHVNRATVENHFVFIMHKQYLHVLHTASQLSGVMGAGSRTAHSFSCVAVICCFRRRMTLQVIMSHTAGATILSSVPRVIDCLLLVLVLSGIIGSRCGYPSKHFAS